MSVSDDVKAGMRETNEWFRTKVVQPRNMAALDKVYTAEARILPPGAEMVRGREEIQAFWGQALAALDVQDVVLSSIEAGMAGDTVVEIGRAELTVAGGDIVLGKYVVVWKQEDGRWKWHIDIWNLNS
jgi:ketosteroid isomerase-like protein